MHEQRPEWAMGRLGAFHFGSLMMHKTRIMHKAKGDAAMEWADGLRRLVSLILQCGSLILHCEVLRLPRPGRIFSQ